MHPKRMSIGPLELRILVQYSLDVIVSRWNIFQRVDGVAERRVIDPDGLCRFEPHEIHAEKLGAIPADLEAGLDTIGVRQDQKHTAGQGLLPGGGGVGEVEYRLPVDGGYCGKEKNQQQPVEGLSHVRLLCETLMSILLVCFSATTVLF